MPARRTLKTFRDSCDLTVRQVESASRKIAESKGNQRYYISNARLTQLEHDPDSEPGIWKLLSLSTIYNVSITELMRLYNVDIAESDKYAAVAAPQCTRLLSGVPDVYRTTASLRMLVTQPEKTTLLPCTEHNGRGGPSLSCGYIGLKDFTMHPIIRPGSFVWIDTREYKLRLTTWHSEYERPIYFVELRDGYVCGWCELQDHQLLIIPHSSHLSIRRLAYPLEAEIVGRVVKFSTSCVEHMRLAQ